jgi:chromosomal replication initiation ATPase DnaA
MEYGNVLQGGTRRIQDGAAEFGFDHSTAIYAYKKISTNRSADARLNNEIHQIADPIRRE